MRQLKSNKGITMTVLVLMVIIMLILAGTVINLIVGDTGVIETAGDAKSQAETTSYKEELKVIEVQTMTKTINKGLSNSEYLSTFKDSVDKDNVFNNDEKQSKTTMKNQTTLRIETRRRLHLLCNK